MSFAERGQWQPETVNSRGFQPAGILGKLRSQETVTVYFSSFGCFSQTGRQLILTRTEAGIMAQLYNGRVVYSQGAAPAMPQSRLIAEKLLDAGDLAEFASFETELGKFHDKGCTTMETYTMISDYGTISTSDGSCNWFGFNQLTEDLFGKIPAPPAVVREKSLH